MHCFWIFMPFLFCRYAVEKWKAAEGDQPKGNRWDAPLECRKEAFLDGSMSHARMVAYTPSKWLMWLSVELKGWVSTAPVTRTYLLGGLEHATRKQLSNIDLLLLMNALNCNVSWSEPTESLKSHWKKGVGVGYLKGCQRSGVFFRSPMPFYKTNHCFFKIKRGG